LSIRIQIGNSKAGENVISCARAGDFSRFTIAASAEVRDLAVLFYTSILERLSRGDMWLQIQSAVKWVRKKNLALAKKKPMAELPDSLLFQLEGRREIEEFLYEFWYRGPLRFYLLQAAPSAEVYEAIKSFSIWPDAQEFHNFFPDSMFAVADLDIWYKSLQVMVLTENVPVVKNALQYAFPLLSHPIAGS